VSQFTAATKGISGQLAGFGKAASRLSAVFAAGFGLSAVTKQLADSVIAFSNLEEQIAAAGQVFGASSEELVKWAEATGEAFGLNQTEAIKAANQLGMYGDAMGLTAEQTREFAQEMLSLSGDLSAFRDVPIDQAIQAIGSAFAGQSRPLRQFTIDTTDAAKAEALLARGIEASVGSMDKQTKALGTYYAILDQSTAMQGQAEREMRQTGTQMRRLSAVTQQLSVDFGRGMVTGMSSFNDGLESVIRSADASGDAMETLGEAVGETIQPFVELTAKAADLNTALNKLTGGSDGGLLSFLGRLGDQASFTAGDANKLTNAMGILWNDGKLWRDFAITANDLEAVFGELGVQMANAGGFARALTTDFKNMGPAAEAQIPSILRLAEANRVAAQASTTADFTVVAANKYYRDAGARAKKLADEVEDAGDKIERFGGSVSSTSQKVKVDLDGLFSGLEYTTVNFGKNTAELTEKQNKRLETLMGAFRTKIETQEKIITDTLKRVEEAAQFSSDVLSTFAGVNLDDFIETDDAGNVNFLADKFNAWASDRAALAQALGPLATVLPQELMMQILAMDNAPARAIAEALNPANAASTEFTQSLDLLTQATQDYLIEPMKAAYGYIGTESAENMLRSAEKEIKKQKKAFKKFVKNQLDTEVTVKVRYEYINPPNPVQTVQAYEARNGSTWRG
jgi:hypothetical protein